MKKKSPSLVMVCLWALFLLVSLPYSYPASAEERRSLEQRVEELEGKVEPPPPLVNPLGTLLFGDLKFHVGYSFTNTLSFTGVVGGSFPPATIDQTDVYKVDLAYRGKPIVVDLIGYFKELTTEETKRYVNMPALWDLLIKPITFDAGIGYARTLETKTGVLTKNLKDDTVYDVGINYTLSIDTLVHHLGGLGLFR